MAAPSHYNIQLVNCTSLGDFEQQLRAASHELTETGSVVEAAEGASQGDDGGAGETPTTVVEHVEVVGSVIQEEPQRLWDRASTLLLINAYKDFGSKFTSRKYRKKTLWAEITDHLQQMGLKYQAVQVEGRWKTLNASYRKALEMNRRLGAGDRERRSCLFFKELHGILGDKRGLGTASAAAAPASGVGVRGGLAGAARSGADQFVDGTVILTPSVATHVQPCSPSVSPNLSVSTVASVSILPSTPPPPPPPLPQPQPQPPAQQQPQPQLSSGAASFSAKAECSPSGGVGATGGAAASVGSPGSKRRRVAGASEEESSSATVVPVAMIGLGEEVGALVREMMQEQQEAERRRIEVAVSMHQDRMKVLGGVLDLLRGMAAGQK